MTTDIAKGIVEIIKALMGPLVAILMWQLGRFIVRGNVTEAESFGLMPIITGLTAILGAWAVWAFAVGAAMLSAANGSKKSE